MIKWLKSLLISISNSKSEFDKTFDNLLKYEKSGVEGSKKLYELLKLLNKNNENAMIDELIKVLKKIRFASNTTDYFYFYFPIVSHILYFNPDKKSEILSYLIGPNFANGTDDADKMIETIQVAMKHKLNENLNYLSSESKLWIENTLPKITNEIKREIDKCKEEING